MTFHVFETAVKVGNIAQKPAMLRCVMKEGGEWGDKDAMLAGLKSSDPAWERPEARFVETWSTWQRESPEPANGAEYWVVDAGDTASIDRTSATQGDGSLFTAAVQMPDVGQN